MAATQSVSRSWSLRRAIDELNGRQHRLALWLFVGVVSTHWVEHLIQAIQVWAFDVPRPKARGALGQVWPGLVSSEGLHYFYAVATMVPLLLLARAFTDSARRWWMAAVVLQAWHLFEHSFLVYQLVTGYRFLGKPVQTSLVQAVVPRIELHLFYNVAVTIPIMVAMILHRRRREQLTCSCARPARQPALATA